jgi:hypothetical protein
MRCDEVLSGNVYRPGAVAEIARDRKAIISEHCADANFATVDSKRGQIYRFHGDRTMLRCVERLLSENDALGSYLDGPIIGPEMPTAAP